MLFDAIRDWMVRKFHDNEDSWQVVILLCFMVVGVAICFTAMADCVKNDSDSFRKRDVIKSTHENLKGQSCKGCHSNGQTSDR